MDIQNEIFNSIEVMIEKAIAKAGISQDIPAIVVGISGEKYNVQFNGCNYWVKDGVGLNVKVGAPVWLRLPNGNYNQMYISAKR